MAVGVQVEGLRELTAQIQAAELALKSPTGLLKVFRIEMLKSVDEIFKAGGIPKWKPLAPSTVSAKRQGTRKTNTDPLPLQGLRNSWDGIVRARSVEIFTDRPEAVFHEFGTKGPYEIKPKTPGTKALALPAFGRQGGGKPGKFTLAGLQRSRATGTGSFIFTAAPGRKTSKRFAGRAGKRVVPYSAIEFFKKVIHPGLAERRMTPTEEQIVPRLVRAANAFLTLRLLGKVK